MVVYQPSIFGHLAGGTCAHSTFAYKNAQELLLELNLFVGRGGK